MSEPKVKQVETQNNVDGTSEDFQPHKRGSFSGIIGLIDKKVKEGGMRSSAKDAAKDLFKKIKTIGQVTSKKPTFQANSLVMAEVISEDDETTAIEESHYRDSRKIVHDAIVPYKPPIQLLKVQPELTKPAGSDSQTKSEKFHRDTSLYDALGVSPDADSAEIRKAYFKLAKDCHPDKHRDDPTAVDKFQMISQSYQVLMDEKTRESYDLHGKAVLDENFMDASSFYAMMFGGDKFKHLVGVFTLAFTALGDVQESELLKFQEAREKELVKLLIKRLEKWTSNKDEFITEAENEYSELSKQEFGLQLLSCIGYTYYHKAEVLIGFQTHPLDIPNFLKGFKGTLREQGHVVRSKLKANFALVKIQTIQEKVESESANEEDAHFSEKFTPELKDHIWLINVLDIESTLRHVVHQVIMDKSISKKLRKERALGIMNLGKIFRQNM